jgi:hypothetical protein
MPSHQLKIQSVAAICLSALLFVSAGSADAAPADAAPALVPSFGDSSFSVSGVTPGGKVVFFATSIEFSGTPAVAGEVRRAEIRSDDDRDGQVRLELGIPLPHRAIWGAVDLTSGAAVMIPSPGYDALRATFGTEQLKNDSNGQLKKLEWAAAAMNVLVVRAGTGAWSLYARKHTSVDETARTNQPLRIDFDSFVAVGDSPRPPGSFKKGDVLLVIDPRRMVYTLLEVGK